MTDLLTKFPTKPHYAIIDLTGKTGHDGEEWYVGTQDVRYLAMEFDEVIEWVSKAHPDAKYHVIWVSPMAVEFKKPTLVWMQNA